LRSVSRETVSTRCGGGLRSTPSPRRLSTAVYCLRERRRRLERQPHGRTVRHGRSDDIGPSSIVKKDRPDSFGMPGAVIGNHGAAKGVVVRPAPAAGRPAITSVLDAEHRTAPRFTWNRRTSDVCGIASLAARHQLLQRSKWCCRLHPGTDATVSATRPSLASARSSGCGERSRQPAFEHHQGGTRQHSGGSQHRQAASPGLSSSASDSGRSMVCAADVRAVEPRCRATRCGGHVSPTTCS
jgi:hypothetical protein